MSINALLLDGWDETSTWGTDKGMFYAQLTPNGVSDDRGPQVWITPLQCTLDNESDLAREIAKAADASIDEVVLAMRRGACPNDEVP